MAKDMTVGTPGKVILAFTVPMVLGNLFQQMYNIVDSVVVGRYVGSDALAAVGASFPIVFLMVAIAMGLTMGASVLISQNFGAGRLDEMRRAVYTSFLFLTVVAIAVAGLGLVIMKPVLSLLNTPANIFDDALAYLGIYFIGLPFMFIYNSGAALLRAIGDSKTPLYFLIFATIVNIVLDVVFVVNFGMGVAGVAWATLIAQGLASILSLLYILRVPALKMKKEDMVFDKNLLKSILKLGVPSMVQQTIVSLGMMAMQGLINSYGSDIVAGYTASTKIDSIAMMPMMNIGAALSTYTAQNVGAGKLDRVGEGYKSTLKISLAICVFISVIIFTFGSTMMHAFVDYDASKAVIDFGVQYLRFVSIFYIVGSINMITGGILRGAGDMKMFMIGSLTNFFTRVASTYILSSFIGFHAIWWGIPIGWAAGCAFTLTRYRSGKWANARVINKGNAPAPTEIELMDME